MLHHIPEIIRLSVSVYYFEKLIKVLKKRYHKVKIGMFEARKEPKQYHSKSEDDLFMERSCKECEICNGKLRIDEFTKLCNCSHQYCEQCLKYYTLHKIRNQFAVIECPKQGCKQIINKNCQTYKNLPVNLQQRYQRIEDTLKYLSNPSFRICPKCEQNQLNKLKGEDNLFCTKCVQKFCPLCLNPAHLKYAKCDNAVIGILKRNFLFKRCPNCLFVVQKNQGCNHMTCMCQFQFCYQCGGNWDQGRHQCPPKRAYVRPRSVRIVRKQIPQRQVFALAAKNIIFNPELNIEQKVKGSRVRNMYKLPNLSRQKAQKQSQNIQNNSSLLINFIPVLNPRKRI